MTSLGLLACICITTQSGRPTGTYARRPKRLPHNTNADPAQIARPNTVALRCAPAATPTPPKNRLHPPAGQHPAHRYAAFPTAA